MQYKCGKGSSPVPVLDYFFSFADEPSKSIIIVGSVLGAATLISLLLALTGCIGYVRVKRRLRVGDEQQPLLQGQQARPQRQQLQNLQNNNDDAGN